MRIRVEFQCSRCGSGAFRPSTLWTFKDAILRKFGVTAQRCFHCRKRFYLFHPAILDRLLRLIADPRPALLNLDTSKPADVSRPVKVVHPPVATDMVWTSFAEAKQQDGSS